MASFGNELRKFSEFKVDDTALTGVKIITYVPRDGKVGRIWMPIWNEHVNTIPGFERLRYAYIVDFYLKGNAAGNHYHEVKEEVIIPLCGTFDIECTDINSGEQLKVTMKENERKGIFIPTKVSHKVISVLEKGVILVLASEESKLEDEIPFPKS